MPIPDVGVKSRIDELYVSKPKDYATLRIQLARINEEMTNQEANSFVDSTYNSYRVGIIEQNKLAGIPKQYRKSVYYGIVLYCTGFNKKEVYIDVPSKNKPILNPDIFYTKKDLDLSLYREYLFEPQGFDFFSSPVVGGIAEVRLPDNFPAHIRSNPEEAVYLGMKRRDVLVPISSDSKKADTTTGNALQAGNSSESDGSTGIVFDKKEIIDRSKNRQTVNGWFRGSPATIEIELIGGYSNSGLYGEVNMANAARRMLAEYYLYRDTNPNKNLIPSNIFNPIIIDGYRSSEDQQKLINKYRNEPGRTSRLHFSNHQSGLAIDFKGTHPRGNFLGPSGIWTEGEGLFYEWLKINAPKYGFKRTVSREHWHWEYRSQWVGSPSNSYKGDGEEPNKTSQIS